MKQLAVIVVLCTLVTGCANGYSQYYKRQTNVMHLADAVYLSKGEVPAFIEVPFNKINERIVAMRSKGFEPIGQSAFSGELESYRNAMKQGMKIGATHVLLGSTYLGTEESTSTISLPTVENTVSNGSYSINGSYGTYSSRRTTTGMKYVPFISSREVYLQGAVYFVKVNRKTRFGLSLYDVPAHERAKFGRNTGAIVDVVLEGSPSFYANLVTGDLVESIGGVRVLNAAHAIDLLAKIPGDSSSATISIVRGGDSKQIEIDLK